MSKVYDNLRSPSRDTTGTCRTLNQEVNDLDLFSFAEKRRALTPQQNDVPPPAEPPPPEVEERHEEDPPPPVVTLRPPAPAPRILAPPSTPPPRRAPLKPSLNIYSAEAANAGVEQEAPHPFIVSRWMWGGLAVVIILLLPFLIFKKREPEPVSALDLPVPPPRETLVEKAPPRETPRPTPATAPVVVAPVARPAPSVPAAQPPSAPAEPAKTIAGVTIRQEGRETQLIFQEGVFSRADQISPAAQPILKQVAEWLASRAATHTIEVVGCTDNDTVRPSSPYKSNHELGLLRAKAVEKYLKGQPGLKAASIRASSQGSERAPFPNDTRQNKQKNRTVILLLVPRTPP